MTARDAATDAWLAAALRLRSGSSSPELSAWIATAPDVAAGEIPPAPDALVARPVAETPARYHAECLRTLTGRGAGDPATIAWHACWLAYALAPQEPANRPRISVVIPLYNRATMVAEAVASVLAQGWPPHEVIVVDDASTDDPEAALARFGPRVRLHRLAENGGVGAARQAGLALATGELVQLLDSDSTMAPDAFAAKVAAFARIADALLCFSGFEVVEGLDRAIGWVSRPPPIGSSGCATNSPAGLVYRFPFPTSSALIARHALLAAGGFDPRLRRHEDRLLFQRLGLAATKCIAIDKPLLRLRIGADSLSIRPDFAGLGAFATLLLANDLLPAPQHWHLAALVLRQLFSREQWQILNHAPSEPLRAESERFLAWLDDFAAGRVLPQLSPRPLAAELTAMLTANSAKAGPKGAFAIRLDERLAAMRGARPPGAADLALWLQSHNAPVNRAAFEELFDALSQELRRGLTWIPLRELSLRPFRALPHPRRRRWAILARCARLLGDPAARHLARWLG